MCARVDTLSCIYEVAVVVVVVNARRGIVYLQKHVRACLLENRFPVYFSLNRSNGIIPNAFWTFFVTIFLSTQNIFMNRFKGKKFTRNDASCLGHVYTICVWITNKALKSLGLIQKANESLACTIVFSVQISMTHFATQSPLKVYIFFLLIFN